MFSQFFSLGLLMLFSVMLPGPDFALVTKNTILHSRRAGLCTALGITIAVIIHLSYCILGFAIIIAESIWLFTFIKYLGAFYLIYLGINSLLTKQVTHISTKTSGPLSSSKTLSDITAFKQGFICNLFNPKATLFFLAVFTMIIKPSTPFFWQLLYSIEMLTIVFSWFCILTLILSHPRVLQLFNKIEILIAKVLGVMLIGFGLALVFLK